MSDATQALVGHLRVLLGEAVVDRQRFREANERLRAETARLRDALRLADGSIRYLEAQTKEVVGTAERALRREEDVRAETARLRDAADALAALVRSYAQGSPGCDCRVCNEKRAAIAAYAAARGEGGR